MSQGQKKILITSILIAVGVGIISSILYPIYRPFILQDENSVGWILGGIFTMYALIAAFILVNVWEKFNNLNNLISQEAQKITSLWTLTDYLDDPEASRTMRNALIRYISAIRTEEIPLLVKQKAVPISTAYFVRIMKAIDKIKFDDERDEPAFQKIIETFEDLSTTRSQRIQTALERIPKTLKDLFVIMTLSLLIIALLHPFNNTLLFSLSIAVLTFVTTFLYQIVCDLDDLYVGTWKVSVTPYRQAYEYIKQINHSE